MEVQLTSKHVHNSHFLLVRGLALITKAYNVITVRLQLMSSDSWNDSVARSSGLTLFGSISKLAKVIHLLACGRCYLNNLSLKIALPARVNKVLREFAGKDLVDCNEVVQEFAENLFRVNS